MKKIILLLAVGAFFLSSKSNGQQFVASFGVTHSWNIPQPVYHSINHDFYGYNVVHASRIINRGHTTFDLILQRGDVFVEVHLGAGGRIVGRTYFDYYPLRTHVCNSYCGFHRTYYNTYRTVCSSRHNHGHNHIVYNRRPATVVYRDVHRHRRGHGYYREHPGRGHAYGHDKGNRGRGNAYGHHKEKRGRGNAYVNNKRNRGRGNDDIGKRSRGYEKSKNGRYNSSGRGDTGRRDRHYTRSRGN